MRSNNKTSSAFGSLLNGLIFAVIAVANLRLLTVIFIPGQFDTQYGLLADGVFFVLFIFFGRYSMVWPWRLGHVGSVGTRAFVSWLFLSAGLLFVGFITKQSEHFSRGVIFAWLTTTPLAFLLAHLAIRYVFLHYFPEKLRARSALIVFVNQASQRLARQFDTMDTFQFKLLGFFDDRDPARVGLSGSDGHILGKIGDLATFVNKHRVDVVFVVLPVKGADRALQIVEELGDTTASVYYVPHSKLFELKHVCFGDIGGIPVLTLTETPFFGADGLLKRVMDILFAGLLLVCLMPLFLSAAAGIWLTMKWPVFFIQHRYGLAGQPISVYKFRTMVVTEDGAKVPQATRDDPRVTPLGRVLRRMSIDELPQLWNVLKGEMSLVGPRPHAIVHNEQYRKLVKRYMVRHKVKPGLTGLAQVTGLRGEIHELENMQRRIECDLDYIQRWSPGLDIYIILRTIWIIFRNHEAY